MACFDFANTWNLHSQGRAAVIWLPVSASLQAGAALNHACEEGGASTQLEEGWALHGSGSGAVDWGGCS